MILIENPLEDVALFKRLPLFSMIWTIIWIFLIFNNKQKLHNMYVDNIVFDRLLFSHCKEIVEEHENLLSLSRSVELSLD